MHQFPLSLPGSAMPEVHLGRFAFATLAASIVAIAFALVAVLLSEALRRSDGEPTAGFSHVIFFAMFFVWPVVLVFSIGFGLAAVATRHRRGPVKSRTVVGLAAAFGAAALPGFWRLWGPLTLAEFAGWAVAGLFAGWASARLFFAILDWKVVRAPD